MTTSNKDLISRTLATRMMACIEEYEAIKRKESKLFKTVKQFCEFNKFSHQNFMKIYTDTNKTLVNIIYYLKKEDQNTKLDELTYVSKN